MHKRSGTDHKGGKQSHQDYKNIGYGGSGVKPKEPHGSGNMKKGY